MATNSSILSGDVDGIVVDAYWGNPVAAAQVIYRDADNPEKSIGAIGDADGHFHLHGLPSRPVLIRVSRIGEVPDCVRIDGGSGQFIRFALRRTATRVCGLVIQTGPPQERPFAISVTVRDARTGKAPATVTISLRDRRFVDNETTLTRDGPADSVVVGAARGRDGVYDVEVTAPGYKPWSLKRVRPIVSDCDEVMGRLFSAWLIPTS